MNFKEANLYLESLINYEKKNIKNEFDFERFLRNLKEFSNPQEALKNPLLIAGTKGKGSTAHHVVSGLIKKNINNVGLFTSPHVMNVRERIRIGNKEISEEEFANYVLKIKEKIEGGIKLTYFESLTIMGFMYFKDKKTDFNVLEIGLGGRLDAVNACPSRFSIVTSISYDHEHILGDTLEKIAYEKSFVIKGGKTIIAPQERKVLDVLIERAKKFKTEVYLLGKDIPFKIVEVSEKGTDFKIYFDNKWNYIHTDLLGDFQAINAGLAYIYLKLNNLEVDEFKDFQIYGRFEKIYEKPLLIADGAHNPLSIRAVVRNVKRIIKKRPSFLIFGSNKDKNNKKILEILKHLEPDFLVLTQSHIPRRESPLVLFDIAKNIGFKKIIKFEDSFSAFEFCFNNSNSNSFILLTGSFYLVELIKRFVQNRSLEKKGNLPLNQTP